MRDCSTYLDAVRRGRRDRSFRERVSVSQFAFTRGAHRRSYRLLPADDRLFFFLFLPLTSSHLVVNFSFEQKERYDDGEEPVSLWKRGYLPDRMRSACTHKSSCSAWTTLFAEPCYFAIRISPRGNKETGFTDCETPSILLTRHRERIPRSQDKTNCWIITFNDYDFNYSYETLEVYYNGIHSWFLYKAISSAVYICHITFVTDQSQSGIKTLRQFSNENRFLIPMFMFLF